MPVKRRTPKTRITELSATAYAFFMDEPMSDGHDEWELFMMKDPGTGEVRESLWKSHKAELLRVFIAANPGRRPQAWWLFDSPERSRRRLGGVGDTVDGHLGIEQTYDHGLPEQFVDRWSSDFYNGRGKKVDGTPMGLKYTEGDFTGVAIDPNDPPRFESQPTFLARHGLLSPHEKRRLKPEDFEPEVVVGACNEQEDINAIEI